MIPTAYLQEWSAAAPWPDPRHVEQDLIICRALCDIFNESFLAEHLSFRGGTAVNKLLFRRPLRYSEDIDLVQVRPEPIGPMVDAPLDPLTESELVLFPLRVRAGPALVSQCRRSPMAISPPPEHQCHPVSLFELGASGHCGDYSAMLQRMGLAAIAG